MIAVILLEIRKLYRRDSPKFGYMSIGIYAYFSSALGTWFQVTVIGENVISRHLKSTCVDTNATEDLVIYIALLVTTAARFRLLVCFV